MHHRPMIPLLTARLRLRPLEQADLDALTEIYEDPQVARWIGPHARRDVEREIDQQVAYQAELGFSLWAVEERTTGCLIGDTGLQPLEHAGPEIELGSEAPPGGWGGGAPPPAPRLVLGHAFSHLGVQRVVAVVKAEHVASQHVLVNAGLRPAGTRFAYGEAMLLYESSSPPTTHPSP
jgi:RimJ/RimL family protein N-acetyltransferase